METNAPAAQASTDTAASQVTAQTDVQSKPQAETPAGDKPQLSEAAGSEQTENTASEAEPKTPDDQPKTWKDKRAERNRQRWQEYKEAKAYRDARITSLEQEVRRLTENQPPDFSQFADPTEELAERTAWKVQQAQAREAEARLQSERNNAASENGYRLWAAWQENVEQARERLPDFDQVFNEHVPIHERAVPFFAESDKGADIAYWLAKNPKEAQALYQKFQTAPSQALIEFGRLEAKISSVPAKQASTAPKPAAILQGGSSPPGFDASKASVSDMSAQLKKAGVLR